MTTDISHTLMGKSSQLNAADIAGPIVVQIERVVVSLDDQPVAVHLVGYKAKPWKPCLTMRRLLSEVWCLDGDVWVGRWVELYRDPRVTWGREAVGGIRVSGLSHIDREHSIRLPVSKSKRETFTVKPLQPPQHSTPKPKTRKTTPTSTQPARSLDDVCGSLGIEIEQLDAWRVSRGRPPIAEMSAEQSSQFAAWLGNQSEQRIAEIKASTNTEE